MANVGRITVKKGGTTTRGSNFGDTRKKKKTHIPGSPTTTVQSPSGPMSVAPHKQTLVEQSRSPLLSSSGVEPPSSSVGTQLPPGTAPIPNKGTAAREFSQTPDALISPGANAFERFFSSFFTIDEFTGERLLSPDIATQAGSLVGLLSSIIPLGTGKELAVRGGRGLIATRARGETALTVIRVGQIPKTAKTVTDAIPKNSRTLALTAKYIEKVVRELKRPRMVAVMALAALGTYPWDQHLQIDNEIITWTMAANNARANGNFEDAQAIEEAIDEFSNPGFLDKFLAAIPGVNVIKTAIDTKEAIAKTNQVNKRTTQHLIDQAEGGYDDDERWRLQKEEETLQEREAVNYFNNQRARMIEFEINANNLDMKGDAEFWARERARIRDEEEKERERQADFWIEYRKTMMLMERNEYENSRPSNLGFGLL